MSRIHTITGNICLICCENIKNKGIVDNTYDLAVVGPDWATLENNEVSIAKNSEEVINLTVFPDYYEIGDYKIKIIAESKTGDISQEKEITVTVEPCFITELTLSTDEDSICAQSSKTYEVSLTNLGKFEEPYSISIEGPEWARLDKNFVELDEGESEVIDLIVDAPDTTGIHDIKIVAKSQEPSETSDEAILSLDIVSKEICFAISLTAELKEVDIAIGEGALIPIKLENRGKESATYSLEISGAGTSFAQLNPSTLAIESGKTEVAYLYIAIPEEVERDKYTLSVSARLEGGTVQASETIDVNVVPVGEGVDVEDIGEPGEPEEQEPTETEEEPEEPKEGIISSITSSIGGAASSVGNRITGAFSGVSGFSTVRDNWKYIVGAIIVILILVLLWQGTKEKSEESKIEKKEEPKEEKPKKRIREEEPEEEKPKKKKKKIVNKIRELLEEEED